ncbi:MAG: hypothetical protein PVH17_06770 [Anaerolineae bacterium]
MGRKVVHFRRRFRALVEAYRAGEACPEQGRRITLDQLTASAQGWANHARYGSTVGLRKAVLAEIAILPAPSRPVRSQILDRYRYRI